MNGNSFYPPSPPSSEPSSPVDWKIILQSVPVLFFGLIWVLWVFFLLIPALFGLHYAYLFSPIENGLFVAMGLVLALAGSLAFLCGHGWRFFSFGGAVCLLAYWF